MSEQTTKMTDRALALELRCAATVVAYGASATMRAEIADTMREAATRLESYTHPPVVAGGVEKRCEATGKPIGRNGHCEDARRDARPCTAKTFEVANPVSDKQADMAAEQDAPADPDAMPEVPTVNDMLAAQSAEAYMRDLPRATPAPAEGGGAMASDDPCVVLFAPPTGAELDRLYAAAAQYQLIVRELFSMEHKPPLHERDTIKDEQAYRAFVELDRRGKELTAASIACQRGCGTSDYYATRPSASVGEARTSTGMTLARSIGRFIGRNRPAHDTVLIRMDELRDWEAAALALRQQPAPGEAEEAAIAAAVKVAPPTMLNEDLVRVVRAALAASALRGTVTEIDDAMVERLARFNHSRDCNSRWDDAFPSVRHNYLTYAHAALTAAIKMEGK